MVSGSIVYTGYRRQLISAKIYGDSKFLSLSFEKNLYQKDATILSQAVACDRVYTIVIIVKTKINEKSKFHKLK